MAKNDYLLELYKTFEKKNNSINVYLKRLKEYNDKVETNVFELIKALKSKFEAIDSFQNNRVQGVSSNHFAVETNPQARDNSDTNAVDLKQADMDINNYAMLANHLFEKAQKDTQFLVQSFQDSLDTVNKIYDTWKNEIENKQNI